jgi:enterochelin esterase-like enzyme
MPRNPTKENTRADNVNPTKTGMRTGNPQVKANEGEEVRSQPRQRAPRPPEGQSQPVKRKSGDRSGG